MAVPLVRDQRAVFNAVEEAMERRCHSFEDRLEHLTSESVALTKATKRIQREHSKITGDMVNFENRLDSGFENLEIKLSHLLENWKKWGTSTRGAISEILPIIKEAMDRDREVLASLILEFSRRRRVETREVVSQAQTTTIEAITQVLENFGHGQLLSVLATVREELVDVPHLLAGVLRVVEDIQGQLGSLAIESNRIDDRGGSVACFSCESSCPSSSRPGPSSGFENGPHNNLAAEMARTDTSVVSVSRQSSSVMCKSNLNMSLSAEIVSISREGSTLQFHSFDTYSLSRLNLHSDEPDAIGGLVECENKSHWGILWRRDSWTWMMENISCYHVQEWCSTRRRAIVGILAWFAIIAVGAASCMLDFTELSANNNTYLSGPAGPEFQTWHEHRMLALKSHGVWYEQLKQQF